MQGSSELNYKGITIDGENSRDLDDAIWAERDKNGYKVSVLISNVARSVEVDSRDDKSAQLIQFSQYNATSCLKPMFKRELSERALSLLAGESRPVVVYSFSIDQSLECTTVNVVEGEYINQNRLTHVDVPLILDQPDNPLYSQINLLNELAVKLLNKRIDNGALAIYDLSTGWGVDEEGNVKEVSRDERNAGHTIVQEFMIMANINLAKYAIENDVPILFRNHRAKAAAPRIKEISNDIFKGFELNSTNYIETFSKRMKLLCGSADVGEVNHGHYGLNSEAYAYFTSPIRRYPDLINQRNILAHQSGKEVPYQSDELKKLAAVFNSKQLAAKERTSDFFKQKANHLGRLNLLKDEFQGLTSKELYRVLRVIEDGNGEVSRSLQNETCRRLEAGLLDTRALTLLYSGLATLFDEAYKKRLIIYVRSNSGLASVILNILKQTTNIGVAKFCENSSGLDHDRVFNCQLNINFKGATYTSTVVIAKSRKVATQLSILDVLQQFIGMRINMPDLQDEQETKPGPLTHDLASLDYKGELQSWCQKNQHPMPVYKTTLFGMSHKPEFSTLVEVQTNEGLITARSDEGKNKKSSEHYAAKKLIENFNFAIDQNLQKEGFTID